MISSTKNYTSEKSGYNEMLELIRSYLMLRRLNVDMLKRLKQV